MLDASEKLIWHSHVPMKVSILAWRLLRDRLPTKINLYNCGIITDADISCVAGCGQVETAHHLFLLCDTFGSLWQHVRAWLGFSDVDQQTLGDHFLQCTNYLGGMKTRQSFLQLICLLCVWLIWKERNNKLFNNIYTLLRSLWKRLSFILIGGWLRANNVAFVYGCQSWWSDPLFCLGIGQCLLFVIAVD